KVVNQIAKNLKSPAKRINQGFFDPSTCFRQLEIIDRTVYPHCRYHAGYHEGRVGQYHPQYALLPVPGADPHHRVTIQSTESPIFLQTQAGTRHAETEIIVHDARNQISKASINGSSKFSCDGEAVASPSSSNSVFIRPGADQSAQCDLP
ncbi:hypothetical protein, partial [Gluconobacter cerinus]|uniref:hypothetical protein n=1 Tax=Gluconobacter cerinus TaxID=38307 RepID=UPI001B8BCA95